MGRVAPLMCAADGTVLWPSLLSLLDDHTWQVVSRIAIISSVMVGWVAPSVFVADSVCRLLVYVEHVELLLMWS